MALPAVWLWNAAEDGHAASHCVDCCVTTNSTPLLNTGLRPKFRRSEWVSQCPGPSPSCTAAVMAYALITTRTARSTGTPSWRRYLLRADSLTQLSSSSPRSRVRCRPALPVMGQRPVPGGLGTAPIGVDRTDHLVLDLHGPAPYRNAWQSPVLAQRADEYREAGANLAANVFDIMRGEGFRDRIAHSPYPRLRALLTALDSTTTSPIRTGTGSLTLPPAGNFASPTFPESAPMSIHTWRGSCLTDPAMLTGQQRQAAGCPLGRAAHAQPTDYKKPAPMPRVRYLHRCHTKVPSLHPKPWGLPGDPFHDPIHAAAPKRMSVEAGPRLVPAVWCC